ncbi:MAG: hypothetical protein MJE77_23150 [Proteobacteria bacterium]|nr:hypothetical protein [Pseudomonadota bacterium]
MTSHLPLEIQGFISPILCWVENTHRLGLPEPWAAPSASYPDREEAWLMRELPTYSRDSLEEIIRAARRPIPRSHLPSMPRHGNPAVPALDPPEGYNLVRAMSKLAERYFQWLGNELCIRAGLMVEIHELAARFPVQHMIRYCHADAAARGSITHSLALKLPEKLDQLHTMYQGLRTEVEKGISEGHLHLTSVLSGYESWADQVMSDLDTRVARQGAEKGRERESDRLSSLGRAAVRILAIGLCHANLGKPGELNLPFSLFDRLDALYWARDRLDAEQAHDQLRRDLRDALTEVEQWMASALGRQYGDELTWLLAILDPFAERWRDEIRGYSGPSPRRRHGIRLRIRALEVVHFRVQEVLIARNGDGSSKQSRERNGQSRERDGDDGIGPQPDPIWQFLHQGFFRYLVYHTHHWRQSVQSGKTTGLRYFHHYFRSPQRRGVVDETEAKAMCFERMVENKALACVEGRLSPPISEADYMPWILSYAAKPDRLEQFGIVVHFIKAGHGQPHEQRAQCGLPTLRHGQLRRDTRRQALRFYRTMTTPHPVVPFIVGIDAANLELTTPPEVFAPAFRFLREYPIEVRHRDTATQEFGRYRGLFDEIADRRLGMTYHVGEDFRHLLSGLRAIHEMIDFLKPLPGDRIGHGIALALDPEVWAEQAGYQAVLPKQEWLDTLVWIHHLLGPGHDLIGELAVEDRIQQLSRAIYGSCQVDVSNQPNPLGRDWAIPALYDSWRLRQLDPYSADLAKLANDRFVLQPPRGGGAEHYRWADIQTKVYEEVDQYIGSNAAYHLLGFYWFNEQARTEGDKIITVSMYKQRKRWLAVCREVQERVAEMVQEHELVVEVNPSSNRFIGPINTLDDHHVYKLTLDEKNLLKRGIRATVNTDNPGVLATSLAHEFYLLGEVLVAAGVPEAEVVNWLRWLRENGRDFSFLRYALEPDNKHLKQLLHDLLERHRPLLRRIRGHRRLYPRVVERWLREQQNHRSPS